MFTVPKPAVGPTDAQLALVKDVYEKTGVLTIKDRTTGRWVKEQKRCGGVAWETPFQDAPEYGSPFQRAAGGNPGDSVAATGGDFSESKYRIRAVYGRFLGTKRFPDGLMLGGVEVWTQDNFFVETDKFTCTAFRPDISQDEIDRLSAYANDSVYVTDELWAQRAEEAKDRREHKLVTQQDPVGTTAKAITAGLGAAIAEAVAQANARGPSQEMLAEIEKLRAENARLMAGSKK